MQYDIEVYGDINKILDFINGLKEPTELKESKLKSELLQVLDMPLDSINNQLLVYFEVEDKHYLLLKITDNIKEQLEQSCKGIFSSGGNILLFICDDVNYLKYFTVNLLGYKFGSVEGEEFINGLFNATNTEEIRGNEEI